MRPKACRYKYSTAIVPWARAVGTSYVLAFVLTFVKTIRLHRSYLPGPMVCNSLYANILLIFFFSVIVDDLCIAKIRVVVVVVAAFLLLFYF